MKVFAIRVSSLVAVFLVLSGPCFWCPEVAGETGTALALGIGLEGYDYPYKVEFLPLTIEGQDVRMAYMDVPSDEEPNGKTVLLLHGKNFFGSYWKDTIRFLTGKGFRVIVPDQLGFGKSSKPNIHYSFHLLAANTKKLMDSLEIKQVVV